MWASPTSQPPRTTPPSHTPQPVEFPDEFAGPSQAPDISFGAREEDRMSIAASQGGLESSGDEGSAALPPSGVPALSESDPELTAVLSRAAESIGLEWNPPPCPERSRLDDWFLGAAHADRQHPPLVPFFPEVHQEVTSSWKAPLTARNRSGTSSAFTALDGGAAKGYAGIPPVERSVAMQLCPQSASAWRGGPKLPSKACKFSSTLVAKAYRAAGQAASALHAMASLQVYQAKLLRQLHEGSADPGVLQEARTATDLALRATKVTARSLGQVMSTLVVQERRLWLNLADMRESDRAQLLNSPVSQDGLFGDSVESFAQQFSAAQKQSEAIRHILPRRPTAAFTPPPAQPPQPARRRGRPPVASSTPARPQQQPSPRPQRGDGRRRVAQPVSAPKPAKRQAKRRS